MIPFERVRRSLHKTPGQIYSPLNVDEYPPEVAFEVAGFESTGEKSGDLSGDLTPLIQN
jgi:hypothetical protein